MKKIFCFICCICLLIGTFAVSTYAATDEKLNTADALYQLDLFLGYGDTYGLKDSLTRNQGVVLLVRMLGKEKEALANEYKFPFEDVADYAEHHVGYAYNIKLVNGYSNKVFGGQDALTDQQYYALVLRALGYKDTGVDKDHDYEDSRKLAYSIGIALEKKEIKNFTRGDVVLIFWRALNTKMKTGNITLAQYLIDNGVFTEEQFSNAARIQKYGRRSDDKTNEKRNDPDPAEPPEPKTDMSYEKYSAMSAEDQYAFYQTFQDAEAFLNWYNAAKAEYDKNNQAIVIDPGTVIDLEK